MQRVLQWGVRVKVSVGSKHIESPGVGVYDSRECQQAPQGPMEQEDDQEPEEAARSLGENQPRRNALKGL